MNTPLVQFDLHANAFSNRDAVAKLSFLTAQYLENEREIKNAPQCLKTIELIIRSRLQSKNVPLESRVAIHAVSHDKRVSLALFHLLKYAYKSKAHTLHDMLFAYTLTTMNEWLQFIFEFLEHGARGYEDLEQYETFCLVLDLLRSSVKDKSTSFSTCMILANQIPALLRLICPYIVKNYDRDMYHKIEIMTTMSNTDLRKYVKKNSIRYYALRLLRVLCDKFAFPVVISALNTSLSETVIVNEQTWPIIEAKLCMIIVATQQCAENHDHYNRMGQLVDVVIPFLHQDEFPLLTCSALLTLRTCNRMYDISDVSQDVFNRIIVLSQHRDKMIQVCTQHVAGYLTATNLYRLKTEGGTKEAYRSIMDTVQKLLPTTLQSDYEQVNYEYYYLYRDLLPPFLFMSTSIHLYVDYLHVLGLVDWLETSVCVLDDESLILNLKDLMIHVKDMYQLFLTHPIATGKGEVRMGPSRYMSGLFGLMTHTVAKVKDLFVPYVDTYIHYTLDQIESFVAKENMEQQIEFVYYDVSAMDYFSLIFEMATSFSRENVIQVFFEDTKMHARICQLLTNCIDKSQTRLSARNFAFHLLSRFAEHYLLDQLFTPLINDTQTEEVVNYIVLATLVPTVMSDIISISPLDYFEPKNKFESMLHYFVVNNALCALSHIINRYISRDANSISEFSERFLPSILDMITERIKGHIQLNYTLDSLTVCNYCVVMLRLSFLYPDVIVKYFFKYLARIACVNFWRMDDGEKKDCTVAICNMIEMIIDDDKLWANNVATVEFLANWKGAVSGYVDEVEYIKKSLVLAKIMSIMR
jgi:hypothetical protein